MAEYKGMKDISLSIDLETKAFTTNLGKVMQYVKSFKSDLDDLNKALKLDSDDVQLVSAKFALLEEKVLVTREALSKLEDDMSNLRAKGITEGDRRFVRLSARIAETRYELQQTNLELIRLEHGFTQTGNAYKKTSEAAKKLSDVLKLNPKNAEMLVLQIEALEQKSTKAKQWITKLNNEISRMKSSGADELSDDMIELYQASAKAKDELEKTNKELARLKSGFTQAENAYKQSSAAVETLKKALSFDPKNAEITALKLEALKKHASDTRDRVEQLKKEIERLRSDNVDELSDEMLELHEAIAEANKDYKETNEQIKSIEKGLDKMLEKANNFSTAFSNFGNWISGVSAKALSALKSAKDNAIEFEAAFANVKKTIDETASTSYGDLEKAIRKMSTEMPETSANISELIGLLGQLGVSADDVEKFAKVMIQLGYSTDLTSEEAGQNIAQIFNILGEGVENIDRFASAVVNLGNNSATTEKDIVNMAGYLASASKSINLTTEDMLGIAAALSSVKLDTSGATALSTIFRKIDVLVSKNSKDLQKWSDVLGMSAEEFSKLWTTDTISAIQRLFEALGNVDDEGGRLSAVLDDLGVKNIRQADTMTRLALAAEMLNGTIQISREGWIDGNKASEEANKMLQTMKSRLQILKQRFDDLSLSIGEKIMPLMEKFMDKVEPLITKTAQWVSENQTLVTVLLGYAAALSPVTKGIGALSKTAGKVIDWVAKGAIPTTEKIALKLGGVALGIGAVVAGITLTVSAIKKAKEWYSVVAHYSDDTLTKLTENNNAYTKSINEETAARLVELDQYDRLAAELQSCYDSNGKIKEGYEERANVIKNTLVEAGIIEREDLDKTIEKHQDLKKAIEDATEAERIRAIVTATEEKKQALQKENQDYGQWLIDNASELAEAERLIANGGINERGFKDVAGEQRAKELLEYRDAVTQAADANEKMIQTYEEMERLASEGNYDQLLALYDREKFDIISGGVEELDEKTSELFATLDNIKASDNGSAIYEQTFDETIRLGEEMLNSVINDVNSTGEEVARAKGYLDQLRLYQQSFRDSSIYEELSSMNRIGGFRSGGFGSGGFASGGFTLNSTINVTTNGAITRTDVQSWGRTLADVINEELGKRL